ncbi:PREDICTED: transport and Golgi organization protein 1 [Ceratosolen solmsi marchali]|uniref:Transport and Golgi organization protein 1 n=1 Tax=Ceratosolen solmsi marchali TaxID=326594 RepID=A0AAJ6YN22_9HYME|nr:PREDICTED: transport and Golgi organization protein 1 [Ceratosolen solmsi marchali]
MTSRRSTIPTMKFIFAVFMILVSVLLPCRAKISDKRLCYDKACSVIISKGKTIIPYNSKDHDVLSFPVNTNVNIFSKQAGSRQDLWGVEIKGKRGYAPSKFIREYQILHTKLEYTVPTKGLDKERVDNIYDTENLDKDNLANFFSSEQQDHNNIVLPKYVSTNNLEENIVPHPVSPSYESVYDGTILPHEHVKEELPPPTYSTKILENNIKIDKEVRLNVYPNLISSTFPILSDIFSNINSEDKSTEDSENESIENSNEKDNDDASLKEMILENVKTDESSLNSEKESNILSENLVIEDNIHRIYNNKVVFQQLIENDNNHTDSLIQLEDSETNIKSEINEIHNIENEAISNLKNEIESSEHETIANKVEISDKATFDKESKFSEKNTSKKENQISKENTLKLKSKISEEDISKEKSQVTEVINLKEEETTAKSKNTGKVESEIINITEKIIEIHLDEINSGNFINNNGNVQQTSSQQVNNNDSSIIEEINTIIEDFQNIVPKQNEVDIIDNLISTDYYTNDIVNEKMLLNEQKVLNETFVPESVNLTISEVPLKNNESVMVSVELSLLSEKPFNRNLSKNEIIDNNNVEIGINLTVNNLFVESDLSNSSGNLEKQLEVNDNIIGNNNYIVNEPANLDNNSPVENAKYSLQFVDSNHKYVDVPSTSSFGEFLGNRNLLNAKKDFLDSEEIELDRVLDENIETTTSENNANHNSDVKQEEENNSFKKELSINSIEQIVLHRDTCDKSYDSSSYDINNQYKVDENAVTNARKIENSSDSLLYVCITAVTTLLFSLGYYIIENRRRDGHFIAKINNLEKDLMITRKECIMLDENLKSTKAKLDSIENQSFGSNEMVLSLKTELSTSENLRAKMEDQITSLEKELESTSEAGLELERMLREILSSHSEENNPLAQSIEDLQDRLNDQQIANESLTNTVTAKIKENEILSEDLKISFKKVEELRDEITRLTDELKTQISSRIHLEQSLSDQVQKLQLQIKTITEDKSHLRKQLRGKELEIKEFIEVVEQMRTNNFDSEKLYEVSKVKAEVVHLLEERDELKNKLSEEEGAHQLLEEHVNIITQEVAFLSQQCKVAEKEKKDAETRLEVLTKFFEEKEIQRQKEEAIWLEKQGEVSSTVEKLQTMQKEILNYKQQIEMLKREILDQEREYKNQMSIFETKAHEQWVTARQNERRLEEVKAESSQLRNRLTLVEKNINDADPEIKLHRLQSANGEAHPLFVTPETSSSPLMFGASGPGPVLPPPLPGSFLYRHSSFAPPPPFLPPPPLAVSRPPPLGGGRLSSPPPGNGSSVGNAGAHGTNETSLPLSPPLPLMSFPHHPLHRHRSPPPLPLFASEAPPPPLQSGSSLLHRHMPPPPLLPQFQSHQHHTWGDEASLPIRNSSGFHTQSRDRNAIVRNHKGSLHSSGESLDNSHHGGKI